MPIAASSAMIAAIVAAGVSPGIAIMSRPTEHTAVIASNLSNDKAPMPAASIMPISSDTGMKAPDSPPTWLEAIAPPFFTASFNSASAAVEPCAPTLDKPIASRIRATESPIAGVGASDKSTMPNGTPSLAEAARPTSSPIRVTLKAARLMIEASSPKSASGAASTARITTPGPETPTLITQSGSPMP